MSNIYIAFFAGIVIGFGTGSFTAIYFSKKLVPLEKSISIILLIVFIAMGIVAFFLNREIPWWMSAGIIGLMGTSLGIDIVSLIGFGEKVKKIKDILSSKK